VGNILLFFFSDDERKSMFIPIKSIENR